ncbi:MAG: type II secretion system protein N [Gammaproteobacteria bacterium]|nr:type II secretion system protein N [Gammaproteobacteria bacterium]MCZ6827944.1 type II secretion system protein N [Gammaproteobacteria bacterium]MCZ6912926.1 type II secretion system protein N [Pseudomonadota bacterium]
MILSTKKLLGVAVASFVFFLALNIPAQVVSPFLDGTPAIMTGVSGTLWNGAAQNFSVDQLQFGRARWRWKPGGLLAGRMEFDFHAGDPGQQLSGRFGLSVNGRIHARNANLELLLTQLGAMPFGTQASIFVGIESLSMAGDWPEHASGTIHLNDTSMNVPDKLTLGDFEGHFKIVNGGNLLADFFDLDGALEIDGTLDLDPSGNYEVTGLIRPRGRMSQRLQNILNFMPRENGAYQLSFSGSL